MIATIEQSAVKLPPSERDFQVFRFVRVENNTTRGAAGVFGISQTRVRQVVSRVVNYLLAVAREGLDDDDEERAGSLSVAEHIARMQLEHLYQKAMQSWDQSQTMNGLGQTTLGQARYLSLAARISLLMSKVPMHAPPRTREEVEEEEEEEEELGESPSEAARPAPPNRDCSPPAPSRPVCEPHGPPAMAASDEDAASYKSLAAIKAEARLRFLRSAQAADASEEESPERGECDPIVSGDDQAESGPSNRMRRPLNRHERRARQRELERLKRLKKR